MAALPPGPEATLWQSVWKDAENKFKKLSLRLLFVYWSWLCIGWCNYLTIQRTISKMYWSQHQEDKVKVRKSSRTELGTRGEEDKQVPIWMVSVAGEICFMTIFGLVDLAL